MAKLIKRYEDRQKQTMTKFFKIPLAPVITTSIEDEKKQANREKMAKVRAMRKTRPQTSEKKNEQEYKIPQAPFSAFKKLKPQIQEFRNEQNVESYENQLYRRDEKQELKREPERSYNKVRIRGDNLLEKSSKLYINILEEQRKTLYDYLK